MPLTFAGKSVRSCVARALLLLSASVATSFALPSPGVAREAQATIQADQPGAEISRHLFGQFAEQLGEGIYGGVWVGRGSPIPNVRGIRSDVVRALRALKVPNVRWPGGCFADQYDWRAGVGQASSRRATYNIFWGTRLESNQFGTDEFMDFVSQIDSQAYLSVNVGSGTPRAAADWLEYMTSAEPTALARETRQFLLEDRGSRLNSKASGHALAGFTAQLRKELSNWTQISRSGYLASSRSAT